MPLITIKSGILGPDGREEKISEYFCDSPNCSSLATHAVGGIRELRLRVALCEEHAAALERQLHKG